MQQQLNTDLQVHNEGHVEGLGRMPAHGEASSAAAKLCVFGACLRGAVCGVLEEGKLTGHLGEG